MILIVGASAGLGRCLAQECARRGHDIVLIARDERDVRALADHLQLTTRVRAIPVAHDVGTRDIGSLLTIISQLGPYHGILFPIGLADENDKGVLDCESVERLIRINFENQVNIVTALWPQLRSTPSAWIVGFGSVAALRGRSRNIVYAAAKRALGSYFESLRHLAQDTPVRIQFYNLGYLKTQQTVGVKLLFPKASPERLARLVLDSVDQDRSPVFYPRYWRVVMIGLKLLPWPIFKRLRF